MTELSTNSMRASMCYWFAGRVFGTWVQLISVACSIASVFVITNTMSDAGRAGQSLSYFILMADFIQWGLRQIMNLDSIMSSCERAYNIIDLPLEPALHQPTYDQKFLSLKWPQKGTLELKSVSMRYRKETDLVLKNLSLNVGDSQRIGIIGRTGAGK